MAAAPEMSQGVKKMASGLSDLTDCEQEADYFPTNEKHLLFSSQQETPTKDKDKDRQSRGSSFLFSLLLRRWFDPWPTKRQCISLILWWLTPKKGNAPKCEYWEWNTQVYVNAGLRMIGCWRSSCHGERAEAKRLERFCAPLHLSIRSSQFSLSIPQNCCPNRFSEIQKGEKMKATI